MLAIAITTKHMAKAEAAQDEHGNPKIGPGAERMTFCEARSCNLCRFVVETMTATIYATVDDGPDRPVWLRLLNGTGRLLRRLGTRWPRLDPEEFLVAAQRRTGLCDWGGGHFRDGLKVLVESFDRQDTAHTFGRLFFREFCIRLLASRLRVEHDLSQYPEIKDVEIRRPLFITGLPRSGTTLLHRLLSQAPGARRCGFGRRWSLLRRRRQRPPGPTRGSLVLGGRSATSRRWLQGFAPRTPTRPRRLRNAIRSSPRTSPRPCSRTSSMPRRTLIGFKTWIAPRTTDTSGRSSSSFAGAMRESTGCSRLPLICSVWT